MCLSLYVMRLLSQSRIQEQYAVSSYSGFLSLDMLYYSKNFAEKKEEKTLAVSKL